MKMFCVLMTAVLVLFVSRPATAALGDRSGVTSEAAAACGGLLDPSVIQQSSSLELHYAFSDLEKDSNKTAASGSGNYMQAISGSFAYSREKDRMKQLGLSWDVAESSSYFARFIPANQTTAYLDCVKGIQQGDDGGVGIAFDDNLGGSPHFRFLVRGSSRSGDRRLVIVTNGVPVGVWAKTFDAGPASVPFGVSWPDPNRPLVVRAQMVEATSSRLIGSQATFVLYPEIRKRKEIHISSDVEARHVNQTGACECMSTAAIIRAADDEMLDLTSIKAPRGSFLPKTWGNSNFQCDGKFEFSTDSDASAVLGYAVCGVSGYANENPGYLAHFEVAGYHLIIPIPDQSISMIEREY